MISIIVPVYCNAGSLVQLHQRLDQVTREFPTLRFEFLFVDDGSYDQSYQVLVEIAHSDPRAKAIKLSRNFGSNIALSAGLHYAQGECAVLIAADLQDPPELIVPMLKRWQDGIHVVMAARKNRDDPLLTRIPAAVFNRMFRKFVFKDFPKNGYDFVLIDRKVIDVIVSCAEKNSYMFGLIMWAGFSRDVIYYDRKEREHGVSMWTFTKKIKYFIDAFSAFSYIPLRIVSSVGLIFAIVGLIYVVIVIIARLFGGIPVEGWSSLMIVLLITAGTQLMMLGIIGEYIWRSLEQTRKRPLFVVDTIVSAQDNPTLAPSSPVNLPNQD